MSRSGARIGLAAAAALLACAACGYKGPLYLPERNATVVTHPAQGAQGASPRNQTQAPAAKRKGQTPSEQAPPAAAPQGR